MKEVPPLTWSRRLERRAASQKDTQRCRLKGARGWCVGTGAIGARAQWNRGTVSKAQAGLEEKRREGREEREKKRGNLNRCDRREESASPVERGAFKEAPP